MSYVEAFGHYHFSCLTLKVDGNAAHSWTLILRLVGIVYRDWVLLPIRADPAPHRHQQEGL